MLAQAQTDVTNEFHEFPNYSVADHGVESVTRYLPMMSSSSDKSFRRLAKMKVQNNLRALPNALRDEAVEKILDAMLSSRDMCLHNYCIDVLIYMAEPQIDEKLYNVVKNNEACFDTFIKTYLYGLLKKDQGRFVYGG